MKTIDIEEMFPDQASWDSHVDEVKSKSHMIALGAHKRNDGTTFPVEVSVTYMTLGKKDYMVAVARDVTERMQAAEALRKSEAMLQAIIDAEPECVKLLDSEGRVIMMNRAGLAIAEFESFDQIKGQCVYPIVAPEYREPFIELTESVFQGKSESLFFQIVGAKGTRRWLDTHAVPFRNEKNEVVALLAVTRDVTERKAAEQALRISEERLSKAQKIAHIGNWEWNLTTNALYWSEEVYRIYGVAPAQYVPTFESVGKAMHPDDLGPFIEAVNAAIHERKHFEMDYRLIRPDGEVRTVHTIGEVSYDPTGKPLVKSGTVQDITERKKAEEVLRKLHEDLEILVEERTAELRMMNDQLRNFSTYLQEAREKERTIIAREIHDELGQALTALKIDLAWMKKRIPRDRKELSEKEASMTELIEATIQSVKRIATELRPGILDHLGLTSAIEWQADEFKKRTGIRCDIAFEPINIVVDRDRSTTIFRVFQETLTNIARHAKATHVEVTLKAESARLVLRVRDNGKGITEKQIADPRSLGLIGMRERAHFWGGQAKIDNPRSGGTAIEVRIPLTKTGDAS